MTAASGTAELALATRGLVKRYGSRTALDGLDLTVPSGVVYGFLGPNGAGKTTTMRLLTGLLHPDAGTVEVLGRPFGRGDRKRLFDVGAIIESPSFYPYLSGRENLRALGGSGAPVTRGRIEELLELVGLRDRAGDKVSRYSLGMKQRLGIAGALLNDPRLLLLDEPGNGLDPAGIAALRDTLRFLAGQGKTVFVSSHLLSEVQQLADIAGIIAKGRLVREGSIAELLATGGVVRVRVAATEVGRAAEVLTAFAGADAVRVSDGEPGTLDVAIDQGRSAEVNRALAEAGIYAAGIEAGSDLESIFLELTGEGERVGRWRAQPGHGRMRLVGSQLRRLVRRPASWITLGMLAAMIALVFIALGASAKQAASQPGGAAILQLLAFPTAYTFVLTFAIQIGSLFAVIYFAAVAGSEWNWGTFKNAVARGESRSRYLLSAMAPLASWPVSDSSSSSWSASRPPSWVRASPASVPTASPTRMRCSACRTSSGVRGWRWPRRAPSGSPSRPSRAVRWPASAPASRSTSWSRSPGCCCRTSCAGCPSTPLPPSSRAPIRAG